MNYSPDELGVATTWAVWGKKPTIHRKVPSNSENPAVPVFYPRSKCGLKLRFQIPEWSTMSGRAYRKCIRCFGHSGVIRVVAEGFHDER